MGHKLIITARVTVDEEEYKEAIVKGWADKFHGEVLDPDTIQSLDNAEDFIWAVPYLDKDDFDIGVV